MKTSKYIVAVLSVSSLLTPLTAQITAVPRVKVTPRKAPTSTRGKWEYCFMASEGGRVTAYIPQGRQMSAPAGSNGFKAIAQVLNRLGEQGWEVVVYQDASGNTGGVQSWTLKRRK